MDANTESIETLSGKVAEAEGKIAEVESAIEEVSGKAEDNESKIAEVDEATKTNAEDIASLGGKVTEVKGKADANAEAIAEVSGKVDANAEATSNDLAEINRKMDANTESIETLSGKVTTLEGKDAYVASYTMTQIRTAALFGTSLLYRTTEFYSAVTSGRVFAVKEADGGVCVAAHTYAKAGVATVIFYDTIERKWYTLTASSTDRYITVTASDTVNLMTNEIYTTDFTMQQITSALGESDLATLSVSTEGFVAALTARKSIFIPDANGGGNISLSGANNNSAVFYVAGSNMFLQIRALDGDTLQLKRRLFNATGYADREVAYKLSGNDGQSGGAIGEVMGEYKIQYRTTVCPNFNLGGFPPLRVGEVLNLRFIFTAGLGDVTVANNSNYQAVRDGASSGNSKTVPAIVDVTVINPAEGAKTVVFYTVKKYS